MPKQTAIKMTEAHAALFRSHGKPHGDGQNLTDGVRTVAAEWKAAGYPTLPPDPCPRGTCVLQKFVSRWDIDTLAILVIAGAGKGASSGARRLAAARQLRDDATLRENVEGLLARLEAIPADSVFWARLAGRER